MKGQFILSFLIALSFKKYHLPADQDDDVSRSSLALFCLVKRAHELATQQYKCPGITRPLLLLLLAGDIQLNPGPRPPKFPCGVCQKAVKWDHQAPSVCCDSCDVWYHQHCLAMPDAVFQALHNVSWECVQCGLPNFSTSLFDTIIINSTNSFEPLTSPVSDACPDLSFSSPQATSSPATARGRSLRGSTSSHDTRRNLPMRVVVANCQSVLRKKPQLESLAEATQADVIIGCESWLDGSIQSNEVFPAGYTAYRRDRSSGNHGGVFILVSSRYESSQPAELEPSPGSESEMVWVQVKIKGSRNLYICSLYLPPALQKPGCLQDFQVSLQKIPNGSHVWVGGDFNLPDIDWANYAVKPYAVQPTLSAELLSIISDSHLDQVVGFPTRITEYTANTLDLFFTNNSTLINTVKPMPGISDHESVFVESSLRPITNKKPPRKIFIYKKANFTSIKSSLKSQLSEFQVESGKLDINNLWSKFKAILTTLMKEHIPVKQIRDSIFHRPWITPHVKNRRRKLQRLFKRAKHSPDRSPRERYLRAKSSLQKEERQNYWRYINSLIDPPEDGQPDRSNQKRFWSYIKMLRRDNTGVAPLKHQGKLHSLAKDKADILNQQYQSVFTEEDTHSIPTPSGTPFPSMDDITVDEAGVGKLLKNINPHKAAGPDEIPAKVLKECAEELAPFLTIIFTKSLAESNVPDDWRHANISAVFKKGDRNTAANYRPVSLTSLCCKIQEHIIASNIMRHLSKHSILTDCQHGFRVRRSCETQLITLAHELASSLDKSVQTDMIILDFSKAFDKVPHKRLLGKIAFYGVRGSTLGWIKAFLSYRTQQVVVDGAKSAQVPVISGVPQGTVLGPLLFLLFINDLPDQLKSKTRLFADDCIIYREIRSEKDCQILQADLNTLSAWELRWGMEFHPQKCNTISCSRSRNPIMFGYKLKGHTLEHVPSAKYLGVDISKDLSWNSHINRISKKANSMVGFLRRNLPSASKATKTNAYFSLVRPHVEYCCSVWSPHTAEMTTKLEAVQRRAARYITNAYDKTTSVSAMLRELDWEPLESRRVKFQLTLLYKIINDLVDIPSHPYLQPGSSRTRSQHSIKFRQFTVRTNVLKYSFFPRSIPVWNSLPASVAEAPSLASFRREIKQLSL